MGAEQYSISGIQIRQVIDDIDTNRDGQVDLIREKPFAIGLEFRKPDGSIAAEETFNDIKVVLETGGENFTLFEGSVSSDNNGKADINLTGLGQIADEIKLIVSGKKDQATLISKTVTAQLTEPRYDQISKKFSIAVVPLSDCVIEEEGDEPCYGSAAVPSIFELNKIKAIIRGVFPVANDRVDVFVPELPKPVRGRRSKHSGKKFEVLERVMFDGLRDLIFEHTKVRPDRVVILMSQTGYNGDRYFKYHGHENISTGHISGYCIPGSRWCLVEENLPSVIVHELGHSYCTRYDDRFGCFPEISPNTGHAFEQNLVSGYLNFTSTEVGSIGPRLSKKDLMISPIANYGLSEIWISPNTYQSVFAGMNREVKASSRELKRMVRLMGELDESGAVLLQSVALVDGEATPNDDAGSVKLDLIDKGGESLGSLSFEPVTHLYETEEGVGSTRAFVVYLPYESGAIAVNASSVSKVAKSYFIQPEIFGTVLDGMPARAFRPGARAEIRRQLETIKEELRAGRGELAYSMFAENLRRQVSDGVFSEYEVTSIFQPTRTEVTFRLNEAIEELQLSISDQAETTNGLVFLASKGVNQAGNQEFRAEVTLLSNPELEIGLTAYVGSVPVKVKKTSSGFDLIVPREIQTGRIKVYSRRRPKRESQSLEFLISSSNQQIDQIRRQMEDEIDPDALEGLRKQLLHLGIHVSNAKARLGFISKLIGRMTYLDF